MLNFIYYPVSAIMWVWHWVFDHILPNTPGGNGVAWALSVVFLVFTLRAILYKPFVKQIRTTKKMQEINPQMQAIRKKYAKDRVKMTEEMQKLQKEHGFNPLLGCLPMLLQVPVFIGLFHVLRSFNRTATGVGQLHMSVEQTRSVGNYVFNVDQVQNFLDARLFGVPLSAFITQTQNEWAAFVRTMSLQDVDFTRTHIAIVVVPMMIIAGIATHMNSRASVKRQPAAALENPQTRMMNVLAKWVFPLGIVVTGPFFPVAILLYWMSNNIWTYGQQHIVFGRIAKEEEKAKQEKQEKLKANAPKPGVKPTKSKKGETAAVEVEGKVGSDADVDDADDVATTVGVKPKPGQKPAKQKKAGSGTSPQAGSKQTGTKQTATKQADATKVTTKRSGGTPSGTKQSQGKQRPNSGGGKRGGKNNRKRR